MKIITRLGLIILASVPTLHFGQMPLMDSYDPQKVHEQAQKQLRKERERDALKTTSHGQKKGRGQNWNTSEYAGRHSAKDIEMALYSKGFAWLSGSPADNEKLSIGKNAQFFGFVAMRYQSGRVAKRGELGRAFRELATPEQRAIMLEAVKAEEESLDAWWETRSQILRILEHHLYTGEPVDEEKLSPLARAFGWLNAEVALHEARAYAAVEDLLTDEQWKSLRAIRKNPALAATQKQGRGRLRDGSLSPKQAAQYEDLFAKAFTWLTGTMDDNEVIPLGQPAQFFGFVSIRHKSGHGANRGKISKQFQQALTPKQQAVIRKTTKQLVPIVKAFKAKRRELLLELEKLRRSPESFSLARYQTIAYELGLIEINAGLAEAQAYQKIRSSMSPKQNMAMMAIRSEYILDTKSMEKMDTRQRGAKIYNLCQSCHGTPQLAPSLENIFDNPIGNTRGFDYSQAMNQAAKEHGNWTADTLDAFLAGPSQFAPGTKMGFQGLLDPADRKAVIEYLKSLR